MRSKGRPAQSLRVAVWQWKCLMHILVVAKGCLPDHRSVLNGTDERPVATPCALWLLIATEI